MTGEEKQLLRYAKRECYEGANMLIILLNEKLISLEQKTTLFEELDLLSERIQAYSNSLKPFNRLRLILSWFF